MRGLPCIAKLQFHELAVVDVNGLDGARIAVSRPFLEASVLLSFPDFYVSYGRRRQSE